MTDECLRKRWQLITEHPTDIAEWCFSEAVILVSQAEQELIECIESQSIIISGASGDGIMMMPLEDWNTLKKKVLYAKEKK